MTAWENPTDIGRGGSSLELWNTFLRDNMTHIKEPPNEQYAPAYAATTTTTAATTFADISANFSLEIETFGGDVLVIFTCHADTACFDISLNASRQGGIDGIQIAGTGGASVDICWLLQDLVAGTHTISIQWKAHSAGTATIDNEFMPYFNVREVS